MALRQTEEEQAVFDHALELVAEQGPMSQEEVDSLSMLEDADLARFHDVWAKLPAGARARLLVARDCARRSKTRVRHCCGNYWTWCSPIRATRCGWRPSRTWPGSRCSASSRISTPKPSPNCGRCCRTWCTTR